MQVKQYQYLPIAYNTDWEVYRYFRALVTKVILELLMSICLFVIMSLALTYKNKEQSMIVIPKSVIMRNDSKIGFET